MSAARAAERTQEQVSRYAAKTGRSALRAPHASRQRQEQRQQPARAEKESWQQEQSRTTVRAKNGSNLALEFSGKRFREVHIDSLTGATTPEGEWTQCDLATITNWIRRTSATTPRRAAGFRTFAGATE